MNNTSSTILEACRNLNFGTFPLDTGRAAWQRAFNDEIILLCRGLPKSQQASALIFLMNYCGISIGSELNFFQNYFPASWTILYHAAGIKDTTPEPEDFLPFIRAHAMAMFLHSLEDHLVDKEVPSNNLTLLLHGEAWYRYRASLEKIMEEDQARRKPAEEHIDRYYTSISSEPEEKTLQTYCDHFRDQMATTTLLVTLLADELKCKEKKTAHIIESFESFGIAWRLLDDLNDMEKDIPAGTRGACYYFLEEQRQNRYGIQESPRDAEETAKHLADSGHLKNIMKLTEQYLLDGAEAAERGGIPGFADELKQMAHPVTGSIKAL